MASLSAAPERQLTTSLHGGMPASHQQFPRRRGRATADNPH
jgi:hypothetical protein